MDTQKLTTLLAIVILILFLVLMVVFYIFLNFDRPVTPEYK